ncbi:MAG: hypothetical protein AB2793_09920, partial [Candidatus Thiodiazotropha sp.]
VLETVDFMSLDGAKAPSPKSGEEVINKFQGGQPRSLSFAGTAFAALRLPVTTALCVIST